MPFPAPPHVIAGARRGLKQLNRYADPADLAQLRQLLGAYAAVPTDLVIVGPGSDLLLREMIHAFARERKVIMASPSFLPTVDVAREAAAQYTALRLSSPAFSMHPELLLSEARGPCLVVIDNPNNPTGQILLDRQTVRALLGKEAALVIIDEAYHEFARMSTQAREARGGSFADLVEDYTNLAVTRTMDKAFSLAGARIGYAVAGEAFHRAFASFSPLLPQPSLHAALAALKAPAYMEQSVRRLVKEREYLQDALRDLGASVYPSHTNFLLVAARIPDMAARLRDRDVRVSDVSNQLPPGFIRVSVGTRAENRAFLAAFAQIGEEQGAAVACA